MELRHRASVARPQRRAGPSRDGGRHLARPRRLHEAARAFLDVTAADNPVAPPDRQAAADIDVLRAARVVNGQRGLVARQ
jgi:hypothetical protein